MISLGCMKSWGSTFVNSGLLGVTRRLQHGNTVSQPIQSNLQEKEFSVARFIDLTTTRPFLPTLIAASAIYGWTHLVREGCQAIAVPLATRFPDLFAAPFITDSSFEVKEMFLIAAGIATVVEIADLIQKSRK